MKGTATISPCATTSSLRRIIRWHTNRNLPHPNPHCRLYDYKAENVINTIVVVYLLPAIWIALAYLVPALFLFLWCSRARTRSLQRSTGKCVRCFYDMQHGSTICPECGLEQPAKIDVRQINRLSLGMSGWQTARLVGRVFVGCVLAAIPGIAISLVDGATFVAVQAFRFFQPPLDILLYCVFSSIVIILHGVLVERISLMHEKYYPIVIMISMCTLCIIVDTVVLRRILLALLLD